MTQRLIDPLDLAELREFIEFLWPAEKWLTAGQVLRASSRAGYFAFAREHKTTHGGTISLARLLLDPACELKILETKSTGRGRYFRPLVS